MTDKQFVIIKGWKESKLHSKDTLKLKIECLLNIKHQHVYKKDRNSTRKLVCACGQYYTPTS